MFKSWKSSTAGIVTAFFAFVLFSPETFSHWPIVLTLAKFATVGGLGTLGIMAKDYNSHSTPDEVMKAGEQAKS